MEVSGGGNTAHAHFEVSVFDNTPRDRMRLIYSLGKQGFSGYGFLPSLRTISFYVLTIDCSGRNHNVMNLCVNVYGFTEQKQWTLGSKDGVFTRHLNAK